MSSRFADAMARVPEYALQPMKDLLRYVQECERLLDISIRGISVLRAMPQAINAIAKAEGDHCSEEHQRSLKHSQELATFAQNEVDSGFPLLHSHTLVGVWGALEAAVEDMLVGILTNEPQLLASESFAKIKITLADFELLDREDRMRLLLQELARSQGATPRQGIDKFEALLRMFDLSGPFDDQFKKILWEMHNVRNVIVHRRSLADRRLVKNCPWLFLKAGDSVVITHDALHGYSVAVLTYLTDIINRLCERYHAGSNDNDMPTPSKNTTVLT
jgi:hypothetical protein